MTQGFSSDASKIRFFIALEREFCERFWLQKALFYGRFNPLLYRGFLGAAGLACRQEVDAGLGGQAPLYLVTGSAGCIRPLHPPAPALACHRRLDRLDLDFKCHRMQVAGATATPRRKLDYMAHIC